MAQVNCSLFITATDTNVGKTVIASALALGLKERGIACGVMKPVQCGGNDAAVLRATSQVGDPLEIINPYFFKNPLSPHLASRLERRRLSIRKILRCYELLRKRYEFLIVEGAGGILVPLNTKFFVADMIREMGIATVIVARAGLGTINHTLLTIEAAKRRNITVAGVIFNQSERGPLTICEKDNPLIIHELSKVKILGFVAYADMRRQSVREQALRQIASKIDIDAILESLNRNEKSAREELKAPYRENRVAH